ncbi:MAG: inosine/xanthosine triphosphatase, partial [Anaerolineales bacterium]
KALSIAPACSLLIGDEICSCQLAWRVSVSVRPTLTLTLTLVSVTVMPIIIIASQNPVKIEAARHGFQAMFPEMAFSFEGAAVPSGVGEQPMSDAETRRGAVNRARNAQSAHPGADFWVGIEGGVEDTPDGMTAFAWVVIWGHGLSGQARTGTFQLPPEVTHLVRQGIELGHADDIVYQRSNSKQKDGAIGILTDGVIDRTAYYEHAVVLALVPFKKRNLYTE